MSDNLEPKRGLKMRKVDITDREGNYITTVTKRLFVPVSHKDEDERYRNAQRAANQETSQEAQVLEVKKSKFEKRRKNFYG